MNDFLQSLRSNQADKQRSAMTRKSYDAAFYNPNPRFQYTNRPPQPYTRSHYSPSEDVNGSHLQDAILSLNTVVESFAENQKHLIKAQEKTNAMLERQVIAIERILDHLNISSK